MRCPLCNHDGITRSPRRGFLETKIYSLFGYFPWNCRGCNERFLLRLRGEPMKG
jgi:hypothetical protein